MINLLPPKQKEELLEEKNLKFTLISGMVFLSFLLSFVLLLFSIRIIVASRLEIQKLQLAQKKKEVDVSQLENVEKEIKNYNKTFSQINTFYKKQVSFTDILEKVTKALPSNVYLTNINFISEEEYFGKISLAGFCPTRDSVTELENNLKKEPKFINIDFPSSNWVLQTNIDCTVNFEIKK